MSYHQEFQTPLHPVRTLICQDPLSHFATFSLIVRISHKQITLRLYPWVTDSSAEGYFQREQMGR